MGVFPYSPRSITVDAPHMSDGVKNKAVLISRVFCCYSCVSGLSGKSAKDMESMTKDQLKHACGEADGSRVFSQFAVQKANWKVY